MITDSTQFPQTNTVFNIQGPAGQLEVSASVVKDSTLPVIGVICHPHPLYGGTMNNKVVYTIMRAFDHLGFSSLRFNFRGVGASAGSYAEGIGESDDLLAVLQWLKQVRPNHQLILAGFSFGSYVATRVASLGTSPLPISQLITVAPPVNHFDFDSLVAELTKPWFVIQGDEDTVVPEEAVVTWVKKQQIPIELTVIKGASHFFHGKLVELRSTLIDFLIPKLANMM